jgi:hypothetical protein
VVTAIVHNVLYLLLTLAGLAWLFWPREGLS